MTLFLINTPLVYVDTPLVQVDVQEKLNKITGA